MTDAQETRRSRPSWASAWGTHLVTLTALVVMLTTVLLRQGTGSVTDPGIPLMAFTLLAWLPLPARTRWPVPVLVIIVAISALQMLLVPHLDPNWKTAARMAEFQPVPIAVAVAAYTVAVQTRRRTGWVAGCVAAAVLPLTALAAAGLSYTWTAIVMCNLILDGTVVGVLVAARRDRLAREEQAQAERTRREVEAERLRIARELHDVLAHHLTLVNAQAGVAEYLVATDPDAANRVLTGLAKHTRQALDEVRATVGLLRAEPTDGVLGDNEGRRPLPTLADMPALVSTVQAADVGVDLTVHGHPRALSPRADLAAYRLIQEGLTNATKHAPGTPVTVELDWRDHHLRIRVANATTSLSSHQAPRSGGHGLVGMAERIRAAGGELTIQRPQPGIDGAFVITATLPADTEPQ